MPPVALAFLRCRSRSLRSPFAVAQRVAVADEGGLTYVEAGALVECKIVKSD